MEAKKIATKKKASLVKVSSHYRNGVFVRGYTRPKRKSSGKRKYSKKRYIVTRMYDPVTGHLKGTKWKLIKSKKKKK